MTYQTGWPAGHKYVQIILDAPWTPSASGIIQTIIEAAPQVREKLGGTPRGAKILPHGTNAWKVILWA
jgi:hypothetical protein